MNANRLNRIAKRLDSLENLAGEQRKQHLKIDQVKQRWNEILHAFQSLLPNELGKRLIPELATNYFCPMKGWVRSILEGRSRLPDCLSQDVASQLVLIWLDAADRCSPFQCVCLHCGLYYPQHEHPPMIEWPRDYVPPQFFPHDGCPACGASTKTGHMNWAHLIADGYWLDRHTAEPNETTNPRT